MREGGVLKRWVTAEGIALGFGVCVATVLLIAAIGKFFYPAEALKEFEQVVSVLEIIFLGAILYLRNRWQIWVFAAFVFSSWCGYALFWYSLELPCSCMGSVIHIPTIFTLLVDIAFFILSLAVARLLGAVFETLYLCLLVGFYLCLGGYAFAEAIYRHYLF